MRGPVGARTAVAALFILSVAVVPSASVDAVAAPEDQAVVLDRGFEEVGTVTVDRTRYEIYRYESVVPYASGYEFFADGKRIEDRDEARRIARAYAWKTALNERIEQQDLEALREVGTTANRAGAVVSAPLSAVETALGAVDEVKQRERLGVSLWDVAVSAVPQLGGIEAALRTTRDQLRSWDERIGEIGDDVRRITEETESVRAGGEAEYEELPGLFENATEGLGEAEEVSRGIGGDLSDAEVLAGGIAEELEGVNRVGEDLASPFRSLSSSLGQTATAVEGFADSAGRGREAVEATLETASSEESRLMTGWRTRQTATVRVYGTGVALLILCVVALYGYRRRESIRSRLSEKAGPDE